MRKMTQLTTKSGPTMKSSFIPTKEAHGEEIIPEYIPLNIFFEDDDILIINKPAGLVVHPGSGNYTGTLINGVGILPYAKKQKH
jgi:23S rRNA pseudouridine1911/1915/1917 synthase